MIATDLYEPEKLDCKQQVLIQKQYSKLILLEIYVKRKQFFIIVEEVKVTISDFSQETVRVLSIYFALIKYQYEINQYNKLNFKLAVSQLSNNFIDN